jgi:hypothetical protein
MPSPSSATSAHSNRRLRPAASSLHGGASSMLRLARKGEGRLPSGAALSDWAERAAAMLDLTPMMVGPQGRFGAHECPPALSRALPISHTLGVERQ